MREKNMIWAYLIHLSTNMWGDPGSNVPYSGFEDKLVTDEETWISVTSFLPECGINTLVIDLGDAVKYESHPEIAVSGAWSKEKLKKELDRLRSLGIKPIPKLNFSTGHDAWMGIYKRMVSTQPYYDFCSDLIKEVTELFNGPELFHLGLDEETYENQRNYQIAVIRNGDLWWHDANFLFNQAESCGARPWIWADSYWVHPEDYISRMSKDVLQSNWFYWQMTENDDGTLSTGIGGPARNGIQAYIDLDRAGFEQVPTSSTWNFEYNSEQTMYLGKTRLTENLVKGYMTAPWTRTVPERQFALMNDSQVFWYARKKIYPYSI